MPATGGRSGDALGTAAAVEALAVRYQLGDEAPRKLAALLDLLIRDPLAPTSIRDPLAAVENHLADSLVALDLRETKSARTVVDIGSGAGLPGLPLAIALPGADFTLLDSGARKCRFIERAIRACELRNAVVVQARAESWDAGRGRFDLATARALASLAVIAEYAAPLLRVGGALVAWRGRRDPTTEAAARAAGEMLGLEVREPLGVKPYRTAEHRHLHLMLKVRKTPAGYPRRPGVARKRPLGAA